MSSDLSAALERGIIPTTKDDLRAKIVEFWNALRCLEVLEFQTVDSIYTARTVMEYMVRLYFDFYRHHVHAMDQSERKIYINDALLHFESINSYANKTFGIELNTCDIEKVLFDLASDG
jgi:hypothetical protein